MSRIPKLNTLRHILTVPSTKQKVEFRPFVHREEKLLATLKESSEQDEILLNIKRVIESCTFGKLDVDTLTSFDLEWIFVQLVIKSVDENSTLTIDTSDWCLSKKTNAEKQLVRATKNESKELMAQIGLCEKSGLDRTTTVVVPLSSVYLTNEVQEGSILCKLPDEEYTLELKYPMISETERFLNESKNERVQNFGPILKKLISDEEILIDFEKDATITEFEEFLDQLSPKHIRAISEALNLPEAALDIEVSCPVEGCGMVWKETVKGMDNFL